MINSGSAGSSAARDLGPGTREQILAAALECFAEAGFEGAKSRAIAERAGVNVGLIKYYFDGKERLWKEAVDSAFAQLRETLDGASPDLVDLGPDDRLRVTVRRMTRFVAANPHFAQLMNDQGKQSTDRMRWLVDRHVRPLYERLEPMIKTLQADGSLRPGVHPVHFFYLAAGALSLIFHQAPEVQYLTGYDPTSQEALDTHVDLVVNLALNMRG